MGVAELPVQLLHQLVIALITIAQGQLTHREGEAAKPLDSGATGPYGCHSLTRENSQTHFTSQFDSEHSNLLLT